ncbi:hypothetical protein F4818DRAFT_454124 [Hypoxylon cercidicola]|nr:hypothetical protein F4818DRAFT_454124 [Hypoxylon cercidicola]
MLSATPTWPPDARRVLLSFRHSSKAVAAPSNSTLGFERIVVVSSGSSWRVDGLTRAAELTGLDLDIPLQPNWSYEEVDKFRGLTGQQPHSNLGRGQAKCWLGHLNALRYIVEHGWASALIMEDDTDWDIAIKYQMSLIAPHISTVTNSISSGELQPYGNSWDLLWIGHCGDAVPLSGVISIFDYTLPETAEYRENNGRHVTLTSKPQQRLIHMSDGPVCTYAYAVTRHTAMKIYEYTKDGTNNIITTDFRHWCQAGFLRCVSVNPELFHHHKSAGQVSSEIAVAESWDTLAAPATVDYTANIRYSTRCNSASTVLVSCQDEFKGVQVVSA